MSDTGDNVSGDKYDLSGDFRGSPVFAGSTVHIHQTPEETYTPPPLPPLDEHGRPPLPPPGDLPPRSRLPHGRNPLFTGREDELCALARQLLYDPARTPAVISTGIGGMGKTQLAVEFAYRYGHYFAGGVQWVSLAAVPGGDATATARAIDDEVTACGLAMGLWPADEPPPPAERVAQTRRAWAGPGQRLLIFDNCETPALLAAWRPAGGGARVLVTSRNDRWPAGFRAQPLPELARHQSVALLREHVGATGADSPDGRADAALAAVAQAVGDLPLALTLAGSYLAAYPSVTTAAYLKSLARPDLLAQIAPQPGAAHSYTDHDLNVARTFALSFDGLRPDDSATDDAALRVLAGATQLLPGEPFPRLLATAMVPDDDPHRPDDAVSRLLALGLLERSGRGGLRLHRLLAAFVVETLGRPPAGDDSAGADGGTSLLGAARGAVEDALKRTLAEVNASRDPRSLRGAERQMGHVVARAAAREDEAAALLCSHLGYYLWMSGDLAGARPLFERALAIDENVYGPDHPEVATDLNNLASLLQDQGNLAGARPLYERALAIYERVLGPEHPDTASALNNLGFLLQDQGDLAGARPLYERALAIRERVLGPEHPDTASAVNNLAGLLYAQGDLAGARPLYERALAIWERVLGPEHPNTAASVNNLAGLLQDQGDLAGARPLYERALAINERVLGPEHPDTASALNNLGFLLQAQGDLAGARPLYERALAISELVLGPEHPDTATSVNNLALLLRAQGDLAGARPLFERALAIWERVLGPEHPSTAISYVNVGALLAKLGEKERAKALLQRAAAVFLAKLGPDHPYTRIAQGHLAGLD